MGLRGVRDVSYRGLAHVCLGIAVAGGSLLLTGSSLVDVGWFLVRFGLVTAFLCAVVSLWVGE